jgi:hypothetical protein
LYQRNPIGILKEFLNEVREHSFFHIKFLGSKGAHNVARHKKPSANQIEEIRVCSDEGGLDALHLCIVVTVS